MSEAGYVVDRVVICDAYREPDKHYRLLTGGRTKLTTGRRPSMRYLASAKDVKGGVRSIVGKQAMLLEDMTESEEQLNDFVNQLRDEVREWRRGEGRWAGRSYAGTAIVTRRLLEWWFERDEERKAEGKRFFFGQQEAVETVIYLYEVRNKQRMPETGELLRYALKLATGTGKTVVMGLLVTWATLHKAKVSGSTLAANFLVLVPNLTVRDRVSGVPRGDGLEPGGSENLYKAFEMVPPEYEAEFRPNVMVKNWQSIPLEAQRDDWIGAQELSGEGRFMPASLLAAMQRRLKQDPNTPIRKMLNGWRDVVIINDEAHHVYGEKRARKGEDPEYIKWSKIIQRIGKVARISLVVDLSATPWYGSGSTKPDGTLFEWLVSDFSVYDAFESGLVKVVRLPEDGQVGVRYLDLWDDVKGAKTKEEYLSACRGAIASLYSDWSRDYQEWSAPFEMFRIGPAPVMLVIADNKTRAEWLFEHLSKDYDFLQNPENEDPKTWYTIRIDSGVFDAEKGNEAVLREMVNTVGRKGQAGDRVRCIVSVNMLSEGWDVKSVTHILGLRAFGSPLLTEQIIGRGLRRASYDVLSVPVEQRPTGADETVDAFGVPFVGFPVEKRKRQAGQRQSGVVIRIEPDAKKERFRVRVPNVRAWGVGVMGTLPDLVDVMKMPELVIDPKVTVPEVKMKPVVGGNPESLVSLEQFRAEEPVIRTAFKTAQELWRRTNPNGAGDGLAVGPTFDELLELTLAYLDRRVRVLGDSDLRDVGIYYWWLRMMDALQTAVMEVGVAGMRALPMLGTPEYLDTKEMKQFQWTGTWAEGKKTHLRRVACDSPLEKSFADFLDKAPDVVRYVKNERFGFSVTYYENNRPRQYFPDFIVVVRGSDGRETMWLAETKGEMYSNTLVKKQAAEIWCQKMSTTQYGRWEYVLVQQIGYERAMNVGVDNFAELVRRLRLK